MNILNKYFDLTTLQQQRFAALQDIYSYWNSRINVVSRKDIVNLYERHVLHSLAIAKVIQFSDNTSVMDVGTGGGFPGIPLAILFPECDFLLVDSIGKKIKVVNAIAETLGLKNVQGMQARAEQVVGSFDFVVSRAVATLNEFIPWVKNKIKINGINDLPNGVLYLKGGEVEKDLKKMTAGASTSAMTKINLRSEARFKIYNLSDYFSEEFFKTKKALWIGI
jgi:16S rRNA (guanine527-N7)-methyltransferase